tara:strand:- start:1313 stop:1423 length:111 start_codon:yes stop_codon:yes gene_type:complete
MLAAMHDIQPGLPRVHVEKTRKNNKPETVMMIQALF